MAEYLESKKLRLNLGKTEIMIFNKGGRRNLVENEKFRFKGQEIKVVEKAKYLGFTLTPNCSWKEHVSEMSKRGKAAVGAILRNDLVKKSKSLKMFKQIFDSKIKPAIHYGAELWGLEAAEKLESVQFRYYKILFGLHQTTHNQLIKGDFGIFSLKLHRLYQVFKFWLILTQLPEDRLAKQAYNDLLQINRKTTWTQQIKESLDKLGLSYLWIEGNGPGNTQCLPEIMQRLKDQEIQEWGCLVRSSETLKEYSKVKEIFGEEYYFKVNLPFRYLKSWIQLRGNCLPVHRGQKKKIRVQMVGVGIAEKRIII